MGEVTSIRGQPIQTPGEPVLSVVETLRDLLEKAEAGEISAFAGAVRHVDGAVSLYDRGDTSYMALKGAVFKLAVDL